MTIFSKFLWIFMFNFSSKLVTKDWNPIYRVCSLANNFTFVQGSSRVHNSCFSIAFVQSPKFLFLTDVINSANKIASLVSKKDGNSSQYLLNASCAISPLWWSLHNPARKKCAKHIGFPQILQNFMVSKRFQLRTLLLKV